MQLTIVEAYAREAVKHATFQKLEDGDYAARVPGLKGVIAFGVSPEDAVELYTVVEDWVRLTSRRAIHIPPMGDIDLNTPENRRLLAYE